MELRVIHVVAPNFGHTFSGQTLPISMLLRLWKNDDIKLDLYGTDFSIANLENPNDSREINDNQTPLWDKNLNNNRIRRLLWAIRVISMIILKNKSYDIIHLHVQWWGGLLSPLFAHLLNKKVVYLMSLEGSDNPSAVASERLGGLKLFLMRKFDGMIGLSPALIEDCRRHGFTSELLVLPNFLTIDSLGSSRPRENKTDIRIKWNIPEDSKVLLFVGSIKKRKGIDLIIDAFVHLSNEFDDLYLLMVGPDNTMANPRVDESYIEQQRKKLEFLGFQNKVLWTGLVVNRKSLAEIYLMSDIFFFPSRAEGQGNVILEAMAAELPIVTSHLIGVTDMMVTDNENGFLIEVDNLEGYIEGVRKLLINKDLRSTMGKEGRERVKREFSFNAYCAKLAEFYLQVDQKIK